MNFPNGNEFRIVGKKIKYEGIANRREISMNAMRIGVAR